MSKKISKDSIKKLLFEKYLSFEIPNEKLELFYNDATKFSNEYDHIRKIFNKNIEKYIINEIKNDNIEMQIKVIEKFKSIITIARQKYTTLSVKDANIIYEQAIEYLKYMYNEDETLSINIVDNFKYIMTNNLMGKSIENREVKLFDISFMSEYIKYNNDSAKKYSELLGCTPSDFDKLIKGEQKVSKDIIDTLCIEFDVNNYDELKEKIKKYIKNKKIELIVSKTKEKKKEVKKNEEPKIEYDLRFMKLYLNKNNVSNETFSKFIGVNINSVDKILDGTYKVTEDKIKRLCDLFNVKSYDELKIVVGKMIVTKIDVTTKEKSKPTKPEEKTDVKRDLNFLKEYIKVFNYPKRNLTNVLSCGDGALEKILDGNLLVKDSLLWELYSEFHVKDYDELKESISKKIENKKQHMEETNKEKDITNLDMHEIFKMLNIDFRKEYDNFILIMLFGGINNKCYTEEEISKILSVNKNYVAHLHKKALEEIKDQLAKEQKLIK